MAKISDAELRASLMDVLDAIPTVNASDIDVRVQGGMVTLSGKVDTHQTRFHVERMARRVSGMRGLQIDIRPTVSPLKKHLLAPKGFRP